MSINLHPATVHFPIAFLLLASGAGLLYLYWRPLDLLRNLTWWPMLLGWLATLLAILTGLLAQSDLPPQAAYRATLNWHITTGLALWVIYGLLLYGQWLAWQKSTRHTAVRSPKRTPPPPDLLQQPAARLRVTLLLLLGALLVVASGWNGGQLVYTWGVNVLQ
ncbi:MAG: DUF2231 domain-containing protein [Caldilineaceae bacterium]|nr:DUF2231 domain-containing protein [Caldilineaceae bacterium]